jgi:hypothetical protein
MAIAIPTEQPPRRPERVDPEPATEAERCDVPFHVEMALRTLSAKSMRTASFVLANPDDLDDRTPSTVSTVRGRKRPASTLAMSVAEELHGDREGEGETGVVQSEKGKTMVAAKPVRVLKHEDRCPGGKEEVETDIPPEAGKEPFIRPVLTIESRQLMHERLNAIRPDPKRASLYQIDKGVGIWKTEMRHNTRVRQKQDIRTAQKFLARQHTMTPFLVIGDALARAGITPEDCEDAFAPGRPTEKRRDLRVRVRAMVLDVDGRVEVGQWAKSLGVSREKLSRLLA